MSLYLKENVSGGKFLLKTAKFFISKKKTFIKCGMPPKNKKSFYFAMQWFIFREYPLKFSFYGQEIEFYIFTSEKL